VLTGFTSTGLLNGETIGSVTETSAGAAANAGVAGGPYTITAGNATGGTFNAGNYNITYAGGSLTVNPAPLTITANSYAKTYDGLAYSGGNGVWYSGYVNGESSNVLGGALTWSGSAQGAVAAGTYVLAPGGLVSSNYAIRYVDGALLINPATGLPAGAQEAVNTAGQMGPGGSGGAGGGAAPSGLPTDAGFPRGTSLAGNEPRGDGQNDGQDATSQSAAPVPTQENSKRPAGRGSEGQLFVIVGPGMKLPEGVE
jgi:hypothetical protein